MNKSVYRIITLLILAFSVFIFSPKRVEAFESGTGVEGDPYVITTCTHLQEIQNDPTAYYVLAQDIDCSDTINWNEGSGFQPIGGGQDFWGTLDGMYFTIYDLYINRPTESGVGLFNTVEGGIVGGLNIERAYIRGSSNVGVVAGRSSEGAYYDIHVKDSTVRGDLEYNDMAGRIGGLVGFSEDGIIFEYSSFEGIVEGHASVGGLLGHSMGNVTISDSYNEGSITGNYYTGGLLGFMIEGDEITLSIAGSYNSGSVSGKYLAGGLVGCVESIVSVEDSYNTGVVSGFVRVGGLVGYSRMDISIIDSYNEGVINGYYRVGGLIGGAEEKVTLLRSHNEGNIVSLLENFNQDDFSIPYDADSYVCVGGLVGAAWKSDIQQSYNNGFLEAKGGARSVGGIIGCGGLIDIQQTYNEGDIESRLTRTPLWVDGVGGVVGIAVNMKLKDSYNKGDIDAGYWDDCDEENFTCAGSPNIGGLGGYTIVTSVRNSYNSGNITFVDSPERVYDVGIGGLIGGLFFDNGNLEEVIYGFGKTFVERVTSYFAEIINNFAVGVISNLYTNSFAKDYIYVGGLIGILDAEGCETEDCENEYLNFQNNWWFNGATKAIGHILNDEGVPEMYSDNETEDRFEKGSAMDVFKTYSHKVYNTDPDWDFETVWNAVYDGKGYPVLGIQELVAPTSPVANVTSGTYSSAFNVSLSSTGTSIRYTVNGSSPTCSIGNIYTTVIPVSSNSVIRAVGCIDGIASSVSVFTYNIASQEESIPLIDNTPSLTKLIIRKNISPNTILNDIVEVVVEENIEHENEVEDLQEEYFGVRIIDSKGNVLIGVRVTIVGKEYITDENGEIEIRDVDNGEYKLKITYNGNDYEQSLILGESDDVQEIVIEDIKKFPWWIVIILCGTLLSIVMYKVVKKENI